MKLLGDQKVNAGWFHYSARHRIALISPPPSTQAPPTSSTPPSSTPLSTVPIFTFYFKPNKIIKMPRFDVDSDGGPLTDQVNTTLPFEHAPFYIFYLVFI
jgi:hypothetical protein